jgi:hypothetical protein
MIKANNKIVKSIIVSNGKIQAKTFDGKTEDVKPDSLVIDQLVENQKSNLLNPDFNV